MARIPEDELERLKREVAITALAEARGVVLTPHGADLIGRCPFHDDHEPSLVITPAKNLWHCLGACQRGGSVIDWVMQAEGLSFRHAVEVLRTDAVAVAAAAPPGRVKRSTVPRLPAPIAREAADHEVLQQLDLARGVLVVREGKGQKDRVVPIGERAIAWLEKYLDEARPDFVVEPDEGTVFLTRRGRPFHPNNLSRLTRDYLVAAGIAKRGACHLLRHTMATGMLEHGADVRVIQEILGHARLTTTQSTRGCRSGCSRPCTPPRTPQPRWRARPRRRPSPSPTSSWNQPLLS